jgi:putative nucleotidyltransferase with HDIG domain
MEIKREETILLVDDEESILDITSEFFELKGYQVFTAENGIEAIKILEKEKIDCCFSDIDMPKMDGLELAERIRNLDNSIPVIIMTGYPSLENTIQTLKNGVVDFLIKPVNMNQMEICLRRVLRERQLFVDNILLKKELAGKKRLEELNRELYSRVDELNILNKIMTGFTTTTSSSDVLKKVIDVAMEVTKADESRFFIINEEVGNPLEVMASFDREDLAGHPGTGAPPVDKAIEQLVMEIASDQIPLLVSETQGRRGLADATRSFLAVPLKIRNKVFGVLTVAVTEGNIRFNEKDLYYISFATRNAARAIENLALYENIYENLFSTLYAFVKAVEARDSYTQQHSTRVTELAVALAKKTGCSSEEIDIINIAGMLHDIGKIGIRDDILLKPGRLTEEEFEKIKEHPEIGAQIIGHMGLWEREQELIRAHHERFDGTGYPRGLKGDEIPKLARVLSVADAYDAMSSDRVYRQKMPVEKILSILKEFSGTQFDPVYVDAFLELQNEGAL